MARVYLAWRSTCSGIVPWLWYCDMIRGWHVMEREVLASTASLGLGVRPHDEVSRSSMAMLVCLVMMMFVLLWLALL